MDTPVIFNGSIPDNYEDYLTPFLFDQYAEETLKRVALGNNMSILELACGTGCVTKQLIAALPTGAKLFATDLQADMLDVAKRSITSPQVTWATVDMMGIPYEDDSFDLIVCQFGIMLVPDKAKALSEIFRVLKKGGQLVFNVWGNIANNEVWNIGGNVIESFIGSNPILQDPGPFCMNKNGTLQLLNKAGFDNVSTTIVNTTGTIVTAEMAAKGFIEGLPVFAAINKKDPALVPKIQQAMQHELTKQLPNHPLRSSLQALVFEAIK